MTRLAYIDPVNGISGDMAISAFVDAGRQLAIDVEGAVLAAITSLGLGCTVTFLDDERGGFACVRTEIKTDDARYLPSQLRAAIERSDGDERAKRFALQALDAIVAAEAKVHGVDAESVHLHELGSADTAADLIGVATAISTLGIDDVASSPVPMPRGSIRTEHGLLPLPAPVSLELLRGATVHGVDSEKELVTPTGAAVLATFVSTWGPVAAMRLDAVGVGGGSRITDVPNICRVLVGERADVDATTERCVLLETNIDDQTPELLGYTLELLLEQGALDAWLANITMKRSRPAFLLSVLARPADEARLTEVIFRNTTTLGVRRREMSRAVLDREIVTVEVDGAQVRVKIARLGDDVVNVAPEFSDCVAASRRTGIPVKVIYARAQESARSS
jgi:uncharacterized protein (TIGR00299 family) protein